MGLAVGSAAPDFSCACHTGRNLSLADYAGQKVRVPPWHICLLAIPAL